MASKELAAPLINSRDLIPLQFDGHNFRIIMDANNNPNWIAKEVCEYFGDTSYRRSIGRLNEDERGVAPCDTPGGIQDMITINESGLWHLLLNMQPQKRKTVTEEQYNRRARMIADFKRWITHIVLPSIRKTGSYSMPDAQNETAQLIGAVKDLVLLVRDLMADKVKPKALPVPDVSYRLKISQLVRRFVAHQTNGYTHQDAFDKLYYEYKYRYHVDLKERAKNSKSTSIMDYAEYTDVKEGTRYVQELYELASILFPETT